MWPRPQMDRYTVRGLIWGAISLAGLAYEIFFRARELFVILGYTLVLGISLYYVFVLTHAPRK